MIQNEKSDFDFHGFMAKKQRRTSKTVVHASQLSAIQIGTVITHLNGKKVNDLSPTELTAMFRTRTVLMRPSIPEKETQNVTFTFKIMFVQIN